MIENNKELIYLQSRLIDMCVHPNMDSYSNSKPSFENCQVVTPSQQVKILRAPRRREYFTYFKILLLLATAGIISLLALLVLSYLGIYTFFKVSDLIIPGVRVGNMKLGGMTVDEAAIALHASLNLQNRIILSNGEQIIELHPNELGLTLDPVLTVQHAHVIGHSGDLIDEFGQLTVSLIEGWPVIPVINLDIDTARSGLEAYISQLSAPAQDAWLKLDHNGLEAMPGQLGYTVNIEETLNIIQADPKMVFMQGRLDVIIMPVLPRVIDASPVIAQAQALIETPASIYAYDAINDETILFTPALEILASWLKVIPGVNNKQPVLTLNDVLIGGYLDDISSRLSQGRFIKSIQYRTQVAESLIQGKPAVVTISHPATSYTVQPGDTLLKIGWELGFPYWMIMNSNPGMDADHLLKGSSLTIPSKDDLTPLPIHFGKRIVISLDQQLLRAYEHNLTTGDKKLVARHLISTGIDRSPTQPGIFQVQTHALNAYASIWDLYMPHFLGIYEAWPGFMNGLHGLPILSNGRRLWADVLGKPASYGCIILDLKSAEWLYHWAEDGVIVEIQP